MPGRLPGLQTPGAAHGEPVAEIIKQALKQSSFKAKQALPVLTLGDSLRRISIQFRLTAGIRVAVDHTISTFGIALKSVPVSKELFQQPPASPERIKMGNRPTGELPKSITRLSCNSLEMKYFTAYGVRGACRSAPIPTREQDNPSSHRLRVLPVFRNLHLQQLPGQPINPLPVRHQLRKHALRSKQAILQVPRRNAIFQQAVKSPHLIGVGAVELCKLLHQFRLPLRQKNAQDAVQRLAARGPPFGPAFIFELLADKSTRLPR